PRDKLGGGPCTYLCRVSKWQWKRMQAQKAKQLLKARLCRECQIYEMRQRAELRAAVSELERPWEAVERAPTLFSSKADEQLKALANRSQFSGGYDLWSKRDETQLFHNQDWLPSARFFPKGAVHNVKPGSDTNLEGVLINLEYLKLNDLQNTKPPSLPPSLPLDTNSEGTLSQKLQWPCDNREQRLAQLRQRRLSGLSPHPTEHLAYTCPQRQNINSKDSCKKDIANKE
ncbi:uncharacterized protein, partial [Aristolochia californica]|uniref:uncharacterized protein n=1 Tax=Aristolochia californica TaxID=171875 RepID=UPI0035D63833